MSVNDRDAPAEIT